MTAKLLHFIATHWILVTLFIIAFVWLIVEEAKGKGMGGARLTPQLATQLINREKAGILDIRDATAFAEGHIVGSINMPAMEIDQSIRRLEKYKQQPLIVVCATGQKATVVMNKLRKQGYTKVYILAGGISAWKSASMPLTKRSKKNGKN